AAGWVQRRSGNARPGRGAGRAGPGRSPTRRALTMLVAFDTATTTASVALYDLTDDTLLAEVTWLARRRHTQDLLVTTQTLLQGLALTPDAITALAVTTGPGSFTGVRIGLSVVKGMGVGLA